MSLLFNLIALQNNSVKSTQRAPKIKINSFERKLARVCLLPNV